MQPTVREDVQLKGPSADQPESIHGLARGRKVRNYLLTFLGWVLFAGFASAGSAYWLLAYTEYGPAVVWRWSIPWFGLAGVSLPIALFGTAAIWRSRNLRFLIFADGFIYTRGRKRIGSRWSEVEGLIVTAVRYGPLDMNWGQRIIIQMNLIDGRQIEVSEPLEDSEVLVEKIKSHIYPRMLDAYRSAFNQGHPIVFGPVTITRGGVQSTRSAIPWGQLESAHLQPGSLVVQPKTGSGGRRISVPADRVPNADLCVQLIEALARQT